MSPNRSLMESSLKWPIIVVFVWGALSVVTGLLGLGDTIFKSIDQRKLGGDQKQITVETGSKRSQLVELVRPVGIHGTRFVATLQIEGETVSLAKGTAIGQVGAGLKLGDQTIGIGIADYDFWMVRESQIQSGSDSRIYKVYVSFKRTQAFIFNEQVEYLVGKLLLKIEPAKP